jgi:hypothetical protein
VTNTSSTALRMNPPSANGCRTLCGTRLQVRNVPTASRGRWLR